MEIKPKDSNVNFGSLKKAKHSLKSNNTNSDNAQENLDLLNKIVKQQNTQKEE